MIRFLFLTFPLLETKKIIDAVLKYGYTQLEIAAHPNMHYATISNLAREKPDD